MGNSALILPDREIIKPARFGSERVQGSRIITLPRSIRARAPANTSRSRQRGFIINPYAYAGETDPYFSYVQSLVHGDGSNGGQTCTDSSTSARTWTFHGSNPTNDTGTSGFFGSAWLKNVATNGYIDTPDDNALSLSSGDFAIEIAFRASSVALGFTNYMVGHADSTGTNAGTGWGIGLTMVSGNCKIYCGIFSGSTAYDVTGTTTVTNNTRHTAAYCRTGNTCYAFLDGNLEGTKSVTGISANNPAGKMSLFRLGDFANTNFDFNDGTGFLEEFRLTVGHGRGMTTSYTPSATAFPNQ